MNKEFVKDLALKNGFKLKQQPNGELELNPYVYDFADALLKNQHQKLEAEFNTNLSKVEQGIDEMAQGLLMEIESLKAQLAQYQSDNYVLVPRVPSEAIKDQINEIIAESVFVETSWGGVNTAQFECGTDEVVYKAMIEAQEQHNAKP